MVTELNKDCKVVKFGLNLITQFRARPNFDIYWSLAILVAPQNFKGAFLITFPKTVQDQKTDLLSLTILGSFTPEGRLAHSTVLVGNKLYFFGGYVDNAKSCTNQVFYLDLSQSFNLAVPPWVSLTQNAGIPFKSCWGTALLNDKEQSIYLFGGIMINDLNQDDFISNVHSFNLNSLSWSVPNIEGTPPERRTNIHGVIDNTGKIYIFGGSSLGSQTIIRYNDMVILNTAELSWVINPASKPAQNSYTATLLTNGVIVYIGGIGSLEGIATIVDIKNINLFDTKSLTWSVKIATASNIIQNRYLHTAVLASEDKIIIYGGSTFVKGIAARNLQAVPDLLVLNMEAEQFELTVPQVNLNVGQVPSLTAHTADLVGNYMIVAFGNITQPNASPLLFRNPNIYIMDIRNYTWVNSFEVTSTNITGSSKTQSSPTSSIIVVTNNSNNANNELVTMKIIIASIGGTVGSVIIIACGFLFYRWNRNRNEQPEFINGEQHNLPG
ncbi:20090_t:CDS:2, partial [Funneliformis geosporum]